MTQRQALIRVREALPSDALRISELYHSLVADARIFVLPDRIDAVAADSRNFLLVAEVAGIVHATAFLTLCLDPMYGHQPFAIVENIVVDGSKQRQGLGAALMRHIETLCWKAGCSKIMLLSSARRTEAHRFFEAVGFSSEIKRGFVKYRRDVTRLEQP